jgi:hypothetical protein
MRSRRRLEFWVDQDGWLLGDAACLVMVALIVPLVPVFKTLECGKRAGKGEKRRGLPTKWQEARIAS